ncbi:MAG: DUF1015 family protein [Bacteroidetes bacterium]|nr:DUF1015 family protein [Bacteroidota bacterium]
MPEFRPFRPFLPKQEALPKLFRKEGAQTNAVMQQDAGMGAGMCAEIGIGRLLQALVPGLTAADRRIVTLNARHIWDSWTAAGIFNRLPNPGFVLYRVRYRDRWQHGWIGLTDARDLIHNRIRKHEHTRADRVAQLSEFTEQSGLQTTPVFLSHPQQSVISRIMFETQKNSPFRNGRLPDGREFSLWMVDNPHDVSLLGHAVAEIPCLYIADGHHRAAVAETQAMSNKEQHFIPMLSILVPSNELHVYPFYRRILNDEGPLSVWSLIDQLRDIYILRPCLIEQMYYQYLPHGQFLLCTGEACWQLIKREQKSVPPEKSKTNPPEAVLDVAILHTEIIGPLVGITDPSRDPRIEYGPMSMHINDFKTMLVDPRTAFVFIARAPTAEDIFKVADSGGVMPPKSTSVEPKIIDGLVVWVDVQ